MDDVIYCLVDMPLNVYGVTAQGADGSYSIYVNARLSTEFGLDVLAHELAHIRQGHFQSRLPHRVLEHEADLIGAG